MRSKPGAVKALAQASGLEIFQPETLRSPEVAARLRAARADAIVVAAYGLLLPPAVLQVAAHGAINIHASLLPRWRGAAPIQRAVLEGDSKTGVTIMRMEAGLDTGPMLAARETEIGAADTAKTLHDRLARLGAELIVETLHAQRLGGVREVPQPSDGVTYAEKINKAEALIDWQQDAVLISRRVRAFNPWPIAETRLNGTQLRIWEARPLDSAGMEAAETGAGTLPGTVLAATHEGIDVACGRGVLRILRLQLAGRRPLFAQEFIKGQRLDGVRFAPVRPA